MGDGAISTGKITVVGLCEDKVSVAVYGTDLVNDERIGDCDCTAIFRNAYGVVWIDSEGRVDEHNTASQGEVRKARLASLDFWSWGCGCGGPALESEERQHNRGGEGLHHGGR